MEKSSRKMNMASLSKSLHFPHIHLHFIDLFRSQILTIKDLRQSDTGNYTCEVFNSFGTINATFSLTVTGGRMEIHLIENRVFSFFRKITIFW